MEIRNGQLGNSDCGGAGGFLNVLDEVSSLFEFSCDLRLICTCFFKNSWFLQRFDVC